MAAGKNQVVRMSSSICLGKKSHQEEHPQKAKIIIIK